MPIKYRVININTGDDITNDYMWAIMPDGRLGYIDYGDFIGLDYAQAIPVDYTEEEIAIKSGYIPYQDGGY